MDDGHERMWCDSLPSSGLEKLYIVAYSCAWDYIKAASEDIVFPAVIATKC